MKLPAASVWLGLAAAAAGLFAFYAAQRYLTDSSAEVERAWQARYAPRDVLVAARDLDPGRPLAAPDLAKRAVPSAFVPGGAFEPARLREVIGKPLLLPLRAGDPIVDSQVAGRNETALAARLSDGARAVTVPVDEVSSQAGLVRPGDRVDLMLAEEIESSDERCIRVKPLLESLAVLATGRVQGDATQGAEASAPCVASPCTRPVASTASDSSKGFTRMQRSSLLSISSASMRSTRSPGRTKPACELTSSTGTVTARAPSLSRAASAVSLRPATCESTIGSPARSGNSNGLPITSRKRAGSNAPPGTNADGTARLARSGAANGRPGSRSRAATSTSRGAYRACHARSTSAELSVR